MKQIIAVLDACVLIPMPLCDPLLRAAEASLYRFHTSEQILEETAKINYVKMEPIILLILSQNILITKG